MLEILERQQFKEGLGRRRADETASKSGSLDALRSDVALIRSNGGRIAIAATVDDMPRVDYSPDNVGNILLADLADIAVEGLSVPVAEITGEQKPEKVVNLDATIDHVQGIEVDGDRYGSRGSTGRHERATCRLFDLRTGKLLRAVEVHKGDRYHPGGIAGDGKSIWVPVAEYRRDSSAIIQQRNRDTLALEAEFEVATISAASRARRHRFRRQLDSRLIYRWTRDGRNSTRARTTAPNFIRT
jgi:hypothetical protein